MQENHKLFLFLESLEPSEEFPCSYFPEKGANYLNFYFDQQFSPSEIDSILNLGYRRFAGNYYKPSCLHCKACIHYRVPVKIFKENRSQRRNRKKFADFTVKTSNPTSTQKKVELYRKYQTIRHDFENKNYQSAPDEIMQEQMYKVTPNSIELEFFNSAGELCGFTILDVGKKTASAVYSVYNTEPEYSGIGIFIILKCIDWCLSNGKTHLHLGLYIKSHPKMEYKSNFSPAEILNQQGDWEYF